jgi:hypothetical protein
VEAVVVTNPTKVVEAVGAGSKFLAIRAEVEAAAEAAVLQAILQY